MDPTVKVFSNCVIIPDIEWMNNATVVHGPSTNTLYPMLHSVIFSTEIMSCTVKTIQELHFILQSVNNKTCYI